MPLPKLNQPMPNPSTNPTIRSLELARFRKKAGLSLEAIAEATKISLRFLSAIEAEEFEKLPGGIFNTSYLKQYAAAVGFDESELLAHYNLKVHPPIPRKPAQIERKSSRSLLDRWLGIPAQAQR